MEQSLWDTCETINNPPCDTVTLPTTTVRFALALFLIQSFTTALWWSAAYNVYYPWLLFVSCVLQLGWLWNKVVESWRQNPQQEVPVVQQFRDPESLDNTIN